jgi:hypothetical protein
MPFTTRLTQLVDIRTPRHSLLRHGGGAYSPEREAGLRPTARELIDRIIAEAEAIVSGRLQGFLR